MSDEKLKYSEDSRGRIWHSMRKADLFLIAGCLLTALLFGMFFVLHRTTGSTIRISCDGMEKYRIDLKNIDYDGQNSYYLIKYSDKDKVHEDGTEDIREEDTLRTEVIYYEQIPELPEKGSYNLISVVNGRVTMEAADCRDQICVHHRPISAGGESIICLPHKLVVEITGGEGKGAEQKRDAGTTDDFMETLDGVTR